MFFSKVCGEIAHAGFKSHRNAHQIVSRQNWFFRHPAFQASPVPGLEVHQHSGAVEPKCASALTLFPVRSAAGIEGRIGCYDG
jgi:hypothetical protein